MKITASSLTNGTLTVIVDDGANIITARKDHPKWNELQEAYKSENHNQLLTLLSLQAVVESYSFGDISVNSAGVTYKGSPLHTVDVNRLMAFMRDGFPYKPIANYISRKMKNPSSRAITEMYNFLEHMNMPITPEGFIIAYKAVETDFYSVTGNINTKVIQGKVDESGRIYNGIGETIEIERSSCDDDFRQACSHGLHAGSLAYAKGYGPRLLLVLIDPADVVSIPLDHNCEKLRCCKYKVLGEYTGPMPDAYTEEFSNQEPKPEENKIDTTPKGDPIVEQPVNVSPSDPWDSLSETEVKDIHRILSILNSDLNLDLEAPNLTPFTKLLDFNFDSLDMFEFIICIESKFGVFITDDIFDEPVLQNIRLIDIVWCIYKLKAGRSFPTVIEELIAYHEGLYQGNVDKSLNERAYINGDELGADSDRHTQYILGYLSAFK